MSQKAEPVPPLGTILGNIGVNTIKFCEEFNNFTKNLSQYFLLKVVIIIFENKTFKFNISKSPITHLINLLKFEKKIKIKIKNLLQEKIINCITLKNVIQLALYIFPNKDLYITIPIV
jgi:ribosomal protein L11